MNDVLSAWEDSASFIAAGPPEFTDLIHTHWNNKLIYCRRASAYDYLVKCWRDREAPDPHRLAYAVCPWKASRRSWK